jgi:dTMP kinase
VNQAQSGRLIALEGIDGCGKSTQAERLASRLGATLTFEPGATAIGERLRHLVLDRGEVPIGDRTEALLMAADRAQHVAEVVTPAVGAGRWVVSDRFSASTLAYQGFGRGLDRAALEELVAWATGGLGPDLTVLIEVPVEVAARRRGSVGGDRFEDEGDAFLRRVAAGYRSLAAADPAAWLVVDGTGSVDQVADAVWSGVSQSLGPVTSHG